MKTFALDVTKNLGTFSRDCYLVNKRTCSFAKKSSANILVKFVVTRAKTHKNRFDGYVRYCVELTRLCSRILAKTNQLSILFE